MDNLQIEKRIRSILKKQLIYLGRANINVDAISVTADFIEDVGIDSVGMIELISSVEKEFDFKMGEGELTSETAGSIEKLLNYVNLKLKDA